MYATSHSARPLDGKIREKGHFDPPTPLLGLKKGHFDPPDPPFSGVFKGVLPPLFGVLPPPTPLFAGVFKGVFTPPLFGVILTPLPHPPQGANQTL